MPPPDDDRTPDGAHPRRTPAQAARRRPGRPLALWALLAVATGVAVWLVPQALRRIGPELQHSQVQLALRDPAARLATPDDWQATLQALQHAREALPDSAEVHRTAATLHRVAVALRPEDTTPAEQRLEHALAALDHAQQAVRLRPADGRLWAQLAYAGMVLQAPPPQLAAAVQRAHALAPHENSVRRTLKQVTLAAWAQEPSPEMAAWVQRLWAESSATERQAMGRAAQVAGVRLGDDGRPALLAP